MTWVIPPMQKALSVPESGGLQGLGPQEHFLWPAPPRGRRLRYMMAAVGHRRHPQRHPPPDRLRPSQSPPPPRSWHSCRRPHPRPEMGWNLLLPRRGLHHSAAGPNGTAKG